MKYSFDDFNSINEGWTVNSLLNCKYFTKYSTLLFSVKKEDINNPNFYSFVGHLNNLFDVNIDRYIISDIKNYVKRGEDYYIRISKIDLSPREPVFEWGYSSLKSFIDNTRNGIWVDYDNYKIFTFEEIYKNLDNILRLILVPNYEPRKIIRTLESNKNKIIYPYKEIYIKLESREEHDEIVSKLKTIDDRVYKIDDNRYPFPNYIFIDVYFFSNNNKLEYTFLTHDDIEGALQLCVYDDPSVNPDYFTLKEWNKIKNILLTGTESGNVPSYKPRKIIRTLESIINEKSEYQYFNKYTTLIIVFDINISESYFRNVLNILNDVFNLNINYDLQNLKYHCVYKDETKFYIEITWNDDLSIYTRGWCYLSYLETDAEHNNYVYPKIVDVSEIDTKDKLERYLNITGNVPSYKPKKFNRLLENNNENLRRKLTNDKYEVIIFDANGEEEQNDIYNFLKKFNFLDNLNILTISNVFNYVYVIITKLDIEKYPAFYLRTFGRDNIREFFRDYHSEFNFKKISPVMTIDELKAYINGLMIPSYKPKKMSRDI